MNNLIINGIDHSVFDLEWAKRGGRLLCQHTSGDKTLGVLSLTGESIETGTLLYGVIYDGFNGWTVRMATPAECESAGIEYIEPPTSESSTNRLQLHVSTIYTKIDTLSRCVD